MEDNAGQDSAPAPSIREKMSASLDAIMAEERSASEPETGPGPTETPEEGHPGEEPGEHAESEVSEPEEPAEGQAEATEEESDEDPEEGQDKPSKSRKKRNKLAAKLTAKEEELAALQREVEAERAQLAEYNENFPKVRLVLQQMSSDMEGLKKENARLAGLLKEQGVELDPREQRIAQLERQLGMQQAQQKQAQQQEQQAFQAQVDQLAEQIRQESEQIAEKRGIDAGRLRQLNAFLVQQGEDLTLDQVADMLRPPPPPVTDREKAARAQHQRNSEAPPPVRGGARGVPDEGNLTVSQRMMLDMERMGIEETF